MAAKTTPVLVFKNESASFETFGINVSVERITPYRARKMLGNNHHHREVNAKKVAEYAAKMSAGAWSLNGKTIVIDVNGKLCGGQHRLHAVIASGVPLVTLVVRGVDPSVAGTM